MNAALSEALRGLPRGTRKGAPQERSFPDDPRQDYASFLAGAAQTLRNETAQHANNGGSAGVGTPAS
ncbi:MAG: hypothetical protein ACRDTD_15290, partial [Pseudonocardiaceae bacterium]